VGSSVMSIPPPPPGFTLDQDSGVPPPPPGFTIDKPQMGGKMPLGMVIDQVLKMAPWNRASQGFRDIAGKGAERLGGMGVPSKVSATAMLPISMTPDILAALTAVPEGTIESPMVESLANKAKTSASSRWFKALGGTLSNAKELGPEESLRLGRLAREGRYITPLNSAESQSKAITQGLQSSGKRIGELRALGDLYGNSPESSKLVQLIHQDIAPKYSVGIHSGEAGDLKKGIEEVLKLEPIDKLTQGEELPSQLGRAGVKKGQEFAKNQYEMFRRIQEDPSYIPEYDLRRPTTFNEVANVATDINKYAKGQSKLLQPSGALTDVANSVSKANDEALLKALPASKGTEYSQNLGKFSDLSKLDRINDLKMAHEVGASRNSIVNNIANRIFHRFGYQLSAETLDKIALLLKAGNKAPKVNLSAIPGINELLKRYRTTSQQSQ
jgi:hypothetical protein